MICEFCNSASSPIYSVSLGEDRREIHRCADCGAAQLADPFSDVALMKFYERDYFSAKPWQIAKAELLARDYFSKVARVAGAGRPIEGPTLEIGAGFGYFARLFHERTSLPVDVVEPSRCCRDFIEQRPCAGAIFPTLLDPAIRPDGYAEIFAFHVVEHLQRFGPFLEDAARCLRDGGRLWILTPNGSSRSFARLKSEWGWAVPDQHYQFLPQSLSPEFCARFGFSLETCTDVRPARIHFPSAWKSRLTRWSAALTRRIDAAAPSRPLTLRAMRRAVTRVSRALNQNVPTWNLCALERAYCHAFWRRPHDELMVVLQKRGAPAVRRARDAS